MSNSLTHDQAVLIASAVLQLFEPLLREEEKRDAFDEVYDRVKAGLTQYELKAERQHKRLHPIPSEN